MFPVPWCSRIQIAKKRAATEFHEKPMAKKKNPLLSPRRMQVNKCWIYAQVCVCLCLCAHTENIHMKEFATEWKVCNLERWFYEINGTHRWKGNLWAYHRGNTLKWLFVPHLAQWISWRCTLSRTAAKAKKFHCTKRQKDLSQHLQSSQLLKQAWMWPASHQGT